ncbi:cytochrome C [Geomonas edaphica]|uniref:cytochrome C n=1 Tax=Geomonas edaphica TaxID=2570226 RepID=UPI0010A9069D|nr:cytochrome C [Geomonas edaphica]
MKKTALLALMLLMLSMLYACANTTSIARVHPEEVKGLPRCAECHTDQWVALNHQTQDFYLKHKFYAAQQREACNACHKESFCVECHAHKEEILPSDKYKERPELALPHRGDYLSRHRIEGRINPASCLKCHGRQNNERCKSCHK